MKRIKDLKIRIFLKSLLKSALKSKENIQLEKLQWFVTCKYVQAVYYSFKVTICPTTICYL